MLLLHHWTMRSQDSKTRRNRFMRSTWVLLRSERGSTAERVRGKMRGASGEDHRQADRTRFGHAGRHLDQRGFVAYSAALKSVAIKLSKISGDLILLTSGPRAGLFRDRSAGITTRLVDHAGEGEPSCP